MKYILDKCRLAIKSSIDTQQLYFNNAEKMAIKISKDDMAKRMAYAIVEKAEIDIENIDNIYVNLTLKGYYFTPKELDQFVKEIRNREIIYNQNV